MSKEMMKMAVLPGDGIGVEVVAEAQKVIDRIAEIRKLSIVYQNGIVGGAAHDATGVPLPEETLNMCLQSDVVLLGAVGGPKWEGNSHDQKPEQALLKLRKELKLFANVRPARVYGPLIGASTLKNDVIQGIDLIVMRELTGGIYFGQPKGRRQENGEEVGFNTLIYSQHEVERIARAAFDFSLKRCKKVTSVDKANVLDSSQLWREVVIEVAKDYPQVELNHMYVDNCAMQLVRNPRQFDVILTGNMFGDILSDEAAMLTGSIGMLPSASLGAKTAMYEPVHGSAPDIAGLGIANPIATIASVAMMFKYSFDMPEEAKAIETAISKVLASDYRTKDLVEDGKKYVSASKMGDLIVDALTRELTQDKK